MTNELKQPDTTTQHVTVFYKHDPFRLENRVYATGELHAAFGVPDGYLLDLVEANGKLRTLNDNAHLHVKEGMEFTSHVPRGQSS